MPLEELELQNFKSHIGMRLPFKKFTIFIGPNSSGKSSILQSLLILKNSLKKNPSEIAIRTESYDYGKFEDVVTLGKKEADVSIKILGTTMLPVDFDDSGTKMVSYAYHLTFNERGPTEVYLWLKSRNSELSYDWKARGVLHCQFRSKSGQDYPMNVSNVDGIHPRFSLRSHDDKMNEDFNPIFINGDFTKNLLNNFYYVPFFRTAIKYGVKLTRLQDDVLENTPEELMSAVISKLSKDTKLLDKVGPFIKELTGKIIRTRNVDLPFVGKEGVTLDFIKNEYSNAIVNEGSGPNQVILLLSTIVGTSNGSIIAIDEPEIHLHPNAQSRLAKIMIDVAKKDHKQIIFATHSEYMIYPFLNSIANGILSSQDVAIYYFSRDENTNLSRIELLKVNEQGQLIGGLKGFWDAEIESFSESSHKKK